MQFRVPLLYSDLTLGNLITIHTEEDQYKRVAGCANITIEQLKKQPLKVVKEADEHLKKIAEMETGKHLPIVNINGDNYGFIPNWDEFTLGEWIDLEECTKDLWSNALKMTSILYRPIKRQQGEAYTIHPYTAKEDPEVFRNLSAELFGGMMLFFSSSRRKLQHTLKSSLMEVAQAQMSSLNDGAGTRHSSRLRMRTSSKWTRLVNSLSRSYSRISHSLKTSNTN